MVIQCGMVYIAPRERVIWFSVARPPDAQRPGQVTTPRWGHGKPPHAGLIRIFEAQKDNYASFLADIAAQTPRFETISRDAPEDSLEPRWNNAWLPALDGMSIYTMIATHGPRHFIEVGSGNSTKFAAKAIRDHALPTKIFSIDPCPRSGIDQLCHRSLRSSLEDMDLSFFDHVSAKDIVFVDCSHRALQNSDVTTFFLDILPRLPVGCRIGIHDICLPEDYPPGWEKRYYNEQYLLACLLLFSRDMFRILLPSMYVSITPGLLQLIIHLQDVAELRGRPLAGSIFWMQKLRD